MKKQLEWNVYICNNTNNEFLTFNVFDSYSFMNDLYKIKTSFIKGKLTQDEFKEEVRKCLAYQYRGRCEYEILLVTWPYFARDGELNASKKINIYDEVMLNFDKFFDYILNNLKLIKKVK